MKEILETVIDASNEELIRAIKEHGLFASDHEGIAIIEEEIMEALEEINAAAKAFCNLKNSVFHDMPAEKVAEQNMKILRAALLGSCELIQVAAMTKKFDAARKGEK